MNDYTQKEIKNLVWGEKLITMEQQLHIKPDDIEEIFSASDIVFRGSFLLVNHLHRRCLSLENRLRDLENKIAQRKENEDE